MTRTRLLLVIGTLLPVLAAEVGIRQIGSLLPDPAPWPTVETRLKVEQMQHLGSLGGADVVFLGTSVTEAAVDPAGLDLGLSSAYNAALPFGSPLGTEVWAEEFVVPLLEPSLVVIGLPSRPPWGSEVADPLRRGLRQVLEFRRPSTPWREWGQASELMRRRLQLRSLPDLLGTPDAPSLWTGSGHQTAYYDGSARAVEGVEPGSTQSVRSTTDNLAAVRRIVRSLGSGGVETVLLLEPGDCPVAVRDCGTLEEVEQWYRDIEALARDLGVVVIDGNEPTWDRALFTDTAHFNRRGTEAFTAFLQGRLSGLAMVASRRQWSASVDVP